MRDEKRGILHHSECHGELLNIVATPETFLTRLRDGTLPMRITWRITGDTVMGVTNTAEITLPVEAIPMHDFLVEKDDRKELRLALSRYLMEKYGGYPFDTREIDEMVATIFEWKRDMMNWRECIKDALFVQNPRRFLENIEKASWIEFKYQPSCFNTRKVAGLIMTIWNVPWNFNLVFLQMKRFVMSMSSRQSRDYLPLFNDPELLKKLNGGSF